MKITILIVWNGFILETLLHCNCNIRLSVLLFLVTSVHPVRELSHYGINIGFGISRYEVGVRSLCTLPVQLFVLTLSTIITESTAAGRPAITDGRHSSSLGAAICTWLVVVGWINTTSAHGRQQTATTRESGIGDVSRDDKNKHCRACVLLSQREWTEVEAASVRWVCECVSDVRWQALATSLAESQRQPYRHRWCSHQYLMPSTGWPDVNRQTSRLPGQHVDLAPSSTPQHLSSKSPDLVFFTPVLRH